MVRFAHAIGEVNEVRALLRTCLARGIALDEVEVVHTDPAHSKMRRFYERWAERSARRRANALLRNVASGPVEELMLLVAPRSGRPAYTR